MKCYECKYLDRSIVLASFPPQYRCTMLGGTHYADDECEYEFMPVVQCKDCKYLVQEKWDDKSILFCSHFNSDLELIGMGEESFCSYGEKE